MARPLRLQFAGAVYHVMARGNARGRIFLTADDHTYFLRVLSKMIDRHHLKCHAYCLMENHYHLLLETPEANLSRAMQGLNSAYSRSFNREHGRVGHVFQGRFKSILVQKTVHLLELSRYVVLNPVRAGLVARPEQWAWSSFCPTAGLSPKPEFLETRWLLGCFGPNRVVSRRRYRRFVASGIGIEPISPAPPVFQGSAEFAETLRPELDWHRDRQEITRSQRFAVRPSLNEIFDRVLDKTDRNTRIRRAVVSHGYSMREVAGHLGLHYATISRVLARREMS